MLPIPSREIFHKTHKQLDSFAQCRDDGKNATGCWIYTGSYTDRGNMMARRDNSDPTDSGLTPNWAWSWPANRRILYNRASADPQGRPWSERKRYVEWDEAQQRWVGPDVPDFEVDKPPSYRPPRDASAVEAQSPFPKSSSNIAGN